MDRGHNLCRPRGGKKRGKQQSHESKKKKKRGKRIGQVTLRKGGSKETSRREGKKGAIGEVMVGQAKIKRNPASGCWNKKGKGVEDPKLID